MKFKFRKGERIEISQFNKRIPKWIWKSRMLSTQGKSLVALTRVKKWMVDADIGVSDQDFNKTIINHQKRIERQAIKDRVPLVMRSGEAILKNLVNYSVASELKKFTKGKRIMARWTPSSSDNPSEEHMLNYGKIFDISVGIEGELPQERPNCQCSMIILNDLESKE